MLAIQAQLRRQADQFIDLVDMQPSYPLVRCAGHPLAKQCGRLGENAPATHCGQTQVSKTSYPTLLGRVLHPRFAECHRQLTRPSAGPMDKIFSTRDFCTRAISLLSRGGVQTVLGVRLLPLANSAGDLRDWVVHCRAQQSRACNGHPANLLKLRNFISKFWTENHGVAGSIPALGTTPKIC